jgi:transcriptional regulator with XRE-family HTH domain
MQDLAARMKHAIAQKRGGSQSELARACGLQQPSVTAWFTGRTKTLKGTSLLKAAKYLEVIPLWLGSGIGPMRELDMQGNVVQVEDRAGSFAPSWPFRSISPAEWDVLPMHLRSMVEGYARGLISSCPPELRAANQ